MLPSTETGGPKHCPEYAMVAVWRMAPWTKIARSVSGRSLLRPLALLLLAIGLAAAVAPAPPPARGGTGAVVVHMDGVIGPASADYLSRSLAQARELDGAAVVLRLDPHPCPAKQGLRSGPALVRRTEPISPGYAGGF